MKKIRRSLNIFSAIALLGLAGGVVPCRAEKAPPPLGEEIAPPDVAEAKRQGFRVVEWTMPAGACAKIKREIVEPLRARNGHREIFGIECATASLTGARVPDILVLARGVGADLNDSRLEGHRLLVFTQAGEPPGSWRIALSTQAMAVGLYRQQIASIQPGGIVRFEWDGRTFAPGPAYDNSRYVTGLDLTKDGFRHRVRLRFSPGDDPAEGMPYEGDRVTAECQVTNLRTGNVRTYTGSGRAAMRQDTIGGDVGQPLGYFDLFLPGTGGYRDGFLDFKDPRCGSGIPSFEQDY